MQNYIAASAYTHKKTTSICIFMRRLIMTLVDATKCEEQGEHNERTNIRAQQQRCFFINYSMQFYAHAKCVEFIICVALW